MTEALEVPAAVRRQQEAAEARRKSAYDAEETPDEGAQGDEGKPAGESAAQDDGQQPAPAAPTGEDADTGEGGETDWEAEYRKLESAHQTLQGKYNKEVPRLHGELRQLREEVQGLQQSGKKPAAESPGTGDEGLEQQIEEHRKELVSEFGEEYADRQIQLMKALARREAQQSAQTVEQRVDRVEKSDQATKEQRFYDTLNGRVSDWESINDDPKFHEWLAEVIPETGEERQAALNRAANNLDGQQVASIFELFKQRQAKPNPKEEARQRKQQEQERQVAPGTRKGTTPPAEPKSYSKADIKKLEEQARTGQIAADEYKQQMSEITHAIQEGRYRA